MRAAWIIVVLLLLISGSPAQQFEAKLPHIALNVFSAGDRLVVVGVDEMIAISGDRGKTWETVHKKPLSDALTGASFGQVASVAYGTHGLLLLSNDGGKTWSPVSGLDANIVMAAAADARHLLVVTGETPSHSAGGLHAVAGSHLWFTRDRGAHWDDLAAVLPEAAKGAEVLSVAALDPQHMAWLFHPAEGENVFAVTEDAGAHWKTSRITDAYPHTLLVRDGEYWALGIGYMDRKNRGGYSVALLAHSKDGMAWERAPKPPRQFHGCTEQACYMDGQNLERVFATKPTFLHPSDATNITARWALSGDTVCSVGDTLRCVQTTEDSEPKEQNSGVVFGPGQLLDGCLRCERVSVPAKNTGKITNSLVLLQAKVNADGTLSSAALQGEMDSRVREEMLTSIADWILTPFGHDSTRTPQTLQRFFVLQCMPESKVQSECWLRPLAPAEEEMVRTRLSKGPR